LTVRPALFGAAARADELDNVVTIAGSDEPSAAQNSPNSRRFSIGFFFIATVHLIPCVGFGLAPEAIRPFRHDYGTIRVVSFVMKREEATRREPGIAVVDVCLQSGESSVLKV
jgi:hypothetical protein